MNYYQIHPCTVKFHANKSQGHSGILLKNDYVLTTASQFLLSLMSSQQKQIFDKLHKNHLIEDLRKFKDLPRFWITLRDEKNDVLIQKEAHICLLFSCSAAKTSLNSILQGFKHETMNFDTDMISLLFSSFLVLGLSESRQKPSKSDILLNILQQVGSSVKSISKLDSIYSLSSLFGSDAFHGTYNSGIISNIFNDCLLILSNPLVQGCEGGGVFSEKTKKLLGIIVGSSFYWKKDNVTLTIAVRLDDILNELIQLGQGERIEEFVPTKRLLKQSQKSEKFVVLIDSGRSWGCGTLINFHGNKFLITCSHVLEDDAPTVYWQKGKYVPQVIYKNPHFNKAFDVAILTPPQDASNDFFTTFSVQKPTVGMKVINVGFPLISSMAKKRFSPFIYDGYVSTYSKGFLTTDTLVQAGQSGGPLLDYSNLKLVGICVSNARDEVDKKIFPNINMAIPICDIYEILQRFFKSSDRSILNELVASNDIQKKWDLEIPVFKAKL